MMILAASLALSQAEKPNELTAQERREGWKLLFDGKTTQGWRGYRQKKMPDGWKVENGVLVRDKGGGDVVTEEEFSDFDLSIEWKISPGGNSGIMYRVTEEESAPYMTGPEYQLLDNAGHSDGKDPRTSAASCYALYAPSKDKTAPVGQWNKTRLRVLGGRVEHWLNGEKVAEYEIGSDDWTKRVAASKFNAWNKFAKAKKGHIDLQDHGDRVEFRSIKVRILSGK